MDQNNDRVVPLIWQGNSADESPNYASRASFYGVGGIPHAQFGGIYEMVGGGTDMLPFYQSNYDALIDLESPLEIDPAFFINANDEYKIKADVEVTGEIDTANNKILLIMTRFISTSYSASVFFYEEQDFELTEPGDTGYFETTVDINPDWQLENLKAVVIVQTFDDDPTPTKHTILQAGKADFGYLNPVSPPQIDFGQIEIGTSHTEQVTVTNYWDMELSGMIFSIPNFEIQTSYSVPPYESIDLDIAFTPTNEMQYQGDIIFTSNHEDFLTIFVTVTGEGYSDTSTEEELAETENYLLNHPNPFVNKTIISFTLPDLNTDAKILIYNIKGQEIKRFTNINNHNSVVWDGKNDNGESVSNGIYFYKIISGRYSQTKKMILKK